MRDPLKPKDGSGCCCCARRCRRGALLGPARVRPPARQGALLELGLPLAADAARCRAPFHCRSKVFTVTMPLRA
ncbi:hypothetical protein DV515_00019835 [Chloebia gouldiae]|uniref:Uncharacterized protein n=1 Tax=Chloebia gouldiae TaxID=44316 RepID=A0A3L8Q3L6_CHLGU|nr:hypothetical protein DV515_00019835 [Chloebia gouldiae]